MLHRRSDEFQVPAPPPVDRFVRWQPETATPQRLVESAVADPSPEWPAGNARATQLLVLRCVQQGGTAGVSKADLQRWLASVVQAVDALPAQERGGFALDFGRYSGLPAMLSGLVRANMIVRRGDRYTASRYTRRLLHLQRETLPAWFAQPATASLG
jgi:hypothetical protein